MIVGRAAWRVAGCVSLVIFATTGGLSTQAFMAESSGALTA